VPAALLDTGPLVAYLYPRDAYHDWAVEQFSRLDWPFLTCEPVITEACFLIRRNGLAPARVLEMVQREVVALGFSMAETIGALRQSIERYANVPMSLADACLVRMVEITGLPICTLDGDFAVYRAHGRHPLNLISPGFRRGLHEP
jgi:predicted nucleic acid-binding protein